MKNRIVFALFAVFTAVMFFLPVQDPGKVDLLNTMSPPSAEHLFGTDNIGRDLYSLFVQGYFRTLTVVIISTALSFILGVSLGLIAGYYGGFARTIIQFISDFTLIIPSFIAALILSAILGFNPCSAGIIMGFANMGEYINQAAMLTPEIKNMEFIETQRVAGVSQIRILFKHILPNIINPILTFMGNRASTVIISYASLAFIGLGSDVTNPDWGTMIYQYRLYIIDFPFLVLIPAFGILTLSLFFHFLFDSRKNRRLMVNVL
jgi:peptide/nickel transport system permease protein